MPNVDKDKEKLPVQNFKTDGLVRPRRVQRVVVPSAKPTTFSRDQAGLVEKVKQQATLKRLSKIAVFKYTTLTIGFFVLGWQIQQFSEEWSAKKRIKQAAKELNVERETLLAQSKLPVSTIDHTAPTTSKAQTVDSTQPAATTPVVDQDKILRQIVVLEERRSALLRQKNAYEDKIKAFHVEIRQRDEKISKSV